MSQTPLPVDPDAERKARRSKLFGRVLILAMGALLLVHMIPYVMSLYAG